MRLISHGLEMLVAVVAQYLESPLGIEWSNYREWLASFWSDLVSSVFELYL